MRFSWPREKKKKKRRTDGKEKERGKEGRKETTRRRTTRDDAALLKGSSSLFLSLSPASPLLSRVFRSRSFSRAADTSATEEGSPKKGRRRRGGGPRRGHVSRARTSATEKDPLLRPHYIVYFSSEPPLFLALLLLPLPPSSFRRCSPFVSSRLGAEAAALFPLRTKRGLRRTCPSTRMTVNRSRGDHRDVLPGDRRGRRRGKMGVAL